MMKSGLIVCIVTSLVSAQSSGQEPDITGAADSNSVLMLTSCAARGTGADSVIECRFSFQGSKIPQYYYEVNRQEKKLILSMSHVRCGGFVTADSLQTLKLGPVKSLLMKETFQNVNQGIKGMLPDLYSVTIASIGCDPVPNTNAVEVRDNGRDIIVDFSWPPDKRKRNELYSAPKVKHTGVIASITAVTAAALAAGGYYVWKSRNQKNNAEDLEPVFPQHPLP